MLDWDDLRTFLLVARHGTLSAAARASGVHQPTMGRRLAALEQRAGAQLLQKTPHGYTPTAAGEAILGNAERIEAEALAAERRISGRDVRLEGVVRVTSVEIDRRRYPDARVDRTAAAPSRHRGGTRDRHAQPQPQPKRGGRSGAGGKAGAERPGGAAHRRHRLWPRMPRRLIWRRVAGPTSPTGGKGHGVILTQDELMGLPEMVWLVASLPRRRQGCAPIRATCSAKRRGRGWGWPASPATWAMPARLVRLATPRLPATTRTVAGRARRHPPHAAHSRRHRGAGRRGQGPRRHSGAALTDVGRQWPALAPEKSGPRDRTPQLADQRRLQPFQPGLGGRLGARHQHRLGVGGAQQPPAVRRSAPARRRCRRPSRPSACSRAATSSITSNLRRRRSRSAVPAC